MRGDTNPPNRAISISFSHDLMTDWIPDALGAADVTHALADGTLSAPPQLGVGWLRVPLARRTEGIPVVHLAVRAHMHLLVERSLHHYRPHPAVFSYRSTDWDYRRAYRARRERMHALGRQADLPLVLKLDVHRFGESLPLHVLLDAPWMTDTLAKQLTELHHKTGRPLLPGHRWANRLGTAALHPIDARLTVMAPDRWMRWGDDWHVFVHDMVEAEHVRAAVKAGLEALGLRLSEEKSTIEPVANLFAGPARDVAGNPPDVWRCGIRNNDVRALRYALPRIDPEAEVSRRIPGIVRAQPTLLPRAVYYLDRAVNASAGHEAVRELLETAHLDLFAVARLLALAGRHQEVALCVPDSLLALAADCGIDALRELAARVAICTRRRDVLPEPSQRLHQWIAQGAHARHYPPSVATLL
ncbi:hypothetical protein AB0H03_34640 [Streptomyces sparsogenes]|uniref:hypothetical protein n=1 Tax=Streptomyces sparsogenes TaxID=67365 RepID=UPI0033DAE4C0